MEYQLDYFSDPEYELCIEGVFMPYYELPTHLKYPEHNEVYVELDELIPTGENTFDIIYFIHDMTEKSTKKYRVSGKFTPDAFNVKAIDIVEIPIVIEEV